MLPNQELTKYLPHLKESYFAALYGLADIQEYYDLDPLHMANGTIWSANMQAFISNSSLDFEDLMLIAGAAKEQNYLDGQVKWLQAALSRAKKDRMKSNLIKNLK